MAMVLLIIAIACATAYSIYTAYKEYCKEEDQKEHENRDER